MSRPASALRSSRWSFLVLLACPALTTSLLAACSSEPESDQASTSMDESSAALFDKDQRAPAFPAAPNAPPVPRCQGKRDGGLVKERWISVDVGGLRRNALVHVPYRYEPDRGAPVILNFHGIDFGPLSQELLTGMNKASDEKGFLAVYPQGEYKSWNAGACCGDASANDVDDVGFVRALLDKLEDEYCVDEHRVYAAGFSNGGFFTYRLACELSDRIAAFTSVAGVVAMDEVACNPTRPVPVLHVHGTADEVVLYDGGVGSRGGLPKRSVAETMTFFAKKNGCGEGRTTIYERGDATCTRFDGCSASPGAAPSEIVLCTVKGAGHTWPGGIWLPSFLAGKVSYDVTATAAAVRFFEAHPLP